MKLQKREIKVKWGDLEITNAEILCEATDEWFNEVMCRYYLSPALNTITFPNGVEVPFE